MLCDPEPNSCHGCCHEEQSFPAPVLGRCTAVSAPLAPAGAGSGRRAQPACLCRRGSTCASGAPWAGGTSTGRGSSAGGPCHRAACTCTLAIVTEPDAGSCGNKHRSCPVSSCLNAPNTRAGFRDPTCVHGAAALGNAGSSRRCLLIHGTVIEPHRMRPHSFWLADDLACSSRLVSGPTLGGSLRGVAGQGGAPGPRLALKGRPSKVHQRPRRLMHVLVLEFLMILCVLHGDRRYSWQPDTTRTLTEALVTARVLRSFLNLRICLLLSARGDVGRADTTRAAASRVPRHRKHSVGTCLALRHDDVNE